MGDEFVDGDFYGFARLVFVNLRALSAIFSSTRTLFDF